MSKAFVRFLAVCLLFVVTSCIVVNFKKAGVLKDSNLYDGRYVAYIDIPAGIYDEKRAKFFGEKEGSKIAIQYLGRCGMGISLSGIMIPIVPWPLFNKCEERGFDVMASYYAGALGVTLQLYYNGITHEPYIDNGSVKFKIPNFSEFKNAPDKALILQKRKPDGTMWTKELPFDWKIVTEVSGGL